MFVPEILDSIFYIAREVVDWIVAKLRKWGYQPLYGHTDSVFVKLKSFAEIPEFLKKINAEVDEFCKARGIMEHHFKLSVDYKCSDIFFDTGHNRYAFLDAETGELVVQGFEGKKVNSSDNSRVIQKQLLRIILETKSEKKAKHFVLSAVHGIELGNTPLEALAYYHTLRKDSLASYVRKTSHIRAMEFSNLFRGSPEYPTLIWNDTHKYLPVTILRVTNTFKREATTKKVDLSKTTMIALALDDDFKAFIDFVNSQGKTKIKVDTDKLLDLNVTRRVKHVVSALGWDFKDVLPSTTKLGKKKVKLRTGQKGMDNWT